MLLKEIYKVDRYTNKKRNNLSKSKICLRIIMVEAVIKYLLETGILMFMLYNNKIFLYILILLHCVKR